VLLEGASADGLRLAHFTSLADVKAKSGALQRREELERIGKRPR
jgi:hypothetical protein